MGFSLDDGALLKAMKADFNRPGAIDKTKRDKIQKEMKELRTKMLEESMLNEFDSPPSDVIDAHNNITHERVQNLINKVFTAQKEDKILREANIFGPLEEELAAHKSTTTFTKYDSEKTNLAILFDTTIALELTAKVMTYGASKYSRKNWANVDDKERYISAPLRHIAAYLKGEYLDKEMGLPHLAAAITSLLFLLEIEEAERKNDGH